MHPGAIKLISFRGKKKGGDVVAQSCYVKMEVCVSKISLELNWLLMSVQPNWCGTELFSIILGFCKWKSGFRCTICSHVCCWWWWMLYSSKLCKELGALWGTCWGSKHCKIPNTVTAHNLLDVENLFSSLRYSGSQWIIFCLIQYNFP